MPLRLLALLGPLMLLGCFPEVPLDAPGGSGDDGGSGSDSGSGSGSGEEGGGSEGSGSGEEGGGSGGSEMCEAWADSDGDGFGAGEAFEVPCDDIPQGMVENGDDCDDEDGGVNPDASEVCNGKDDDCDGATDDDDDSVDPESFSTWHVDSDGDGFGDPDATVETCDKPSNGSTNDGDCDDGNAEVNPDADEACNGIDDDCDGTADSDDACPCPVEYHDDHSYLYCKDETSWHDAEEACEKLDNYLLIVVDDADEQEWLWDTASDYSSSRWWWLGYHNKGASDGDEPDGGFEWVDGSSNGYENWHSGQPDDHRGDEDCVHIDPDHGYWNDLDCDTDEYGWTSMSYVCESTVP